MREQIQKPLTDKPWPKQVHDEGAPKIPDISKPDTSRILKRMRSIAPDQSRKFRQRSGE